MSKRKEQRKENLGPSPILMWIFVFILIVVFFLLVNSSLFNVTSITVEGNNRFSQQEIINASGIDYNTNIIHVDEAQAKTNIEQNAFIVVEDITRTFPTGIVIKVRERSAVAQIGTVNGYYVIDKEGIALGLNNTADSSLVVVYNMGIAEPQYGKQIQSDSAEKMESVFSVLTAMEKYDLVYKIKGIDVENPEKIRLTYEGGITVQIGNSFSADDRLRRLDVTVNAVKQIITAGQVLHMESADSYYIGQ